MTGKNVTLRLLDKADREILKLPRPVKGAIYDFQHKFKTKPPMLDATLAELAKDRDQLRARL